MPKEDVFEKRKKVIIEWLKDPYNLTLIGIIVFAFAVRAYFFFSTLGQPLWWDEAGYMSAAKHFAFGLSFVLNPQRPPLFQALAALIFLAGLGGNAIKFTLVLLPSVFLVFAVYLLGKEMFNKKIGLIAGFLTAVSWTFIFWTNRIQPDFISMCFQVLAIFFMWKYWNKGNKGTWLVVIAGILSALGFYTKVSALLVPLIIGIFVLMKERGDAFRNKDNYIFVLSFFVSLIPYFIWSYITFGTFTAFKAGYSSGIQTAEAFAWVNLSYYYLLTESVLFVLFLVGVFLALKFLLYGDILLKKKEKMLDSNIFSILVFIIVSAFYIFYIRGTEDRWVFIWLPFIFFLIGNALLFIYNLVKRYNKQIAILLIVGLLAWGAYAQLSHASSLITVKQNTYLPVKQAALWMKDHSSSGNIMMTKSQTQTTYYSDRKTLSFGPDSQNITQFDKYFNKTKPKFVEVSAFEKYPSWTSQWLKENKNRLKIVNIYFADAQHRQPILIVYQPTYS